MAKPRCNTLNSEMDNPKKNWQQRELGQEEITSKIENFFWSRSNQGLSNITKRNPPSQRYDFKTQVRVRRLKPTEVYLSDLRNVSNSNSRSKYVTKRLLWKMETPSWVNKLKLEEDEQFKRNISNTNSSSSRSLYKVTQKKRIKQTEARRGWPNPKGTPTPTPYENTQEEEEQMEKPKLHGNSWTHDGIPERKYSITQIDFIQAGISETNLHGDSNQHGTQKIHTHITFMATSIKMEPCIRHGNSNQDGTLHNAWQLQSRWNPKIKKRHKHTEKHNLQAMTD